MQQHKIFLESSNSLSDLALFLSQKIHTSELHIFEPVYIVTQTEGMNSWLKLQLAENLGIAANIVFIKPNELVNKLYYWLGGRFSKALSAQNIVWLIFKILGEKEFTGKFPLVADYYSGSGNEKDVKRMSLAEKIADLFDQYQVYRPDMIALWNDGNLQTKLPEEEWQQYIWEAAKKQAGGLLPDKTVIKKYIEETLKNPDAVEKLLQKITSVYLFGISVITEYHLALLQLVSQILPVHFLILNPSPSLYWYEDKSEKTLAFLRRKGILKEPESFLSNPLLTNWGKIIQDTFTLLFKSEEVINSYEVISENEYLANSLLHKIQKSIFENTPVTEPKITEDDLNDGTLCIHSCFNAFREVEALYNYLVQLADQRNEKLSPRDIVVMVSDIELYGSYIRAVFDHAPYQFKYTIADETYTTSDSVIHAMIAICELHSGSFTAENVYRLLDFGCIRKKFRIENLELIREVIDEANIRFGMEGSRHDHSVYVSWQYGLQRIMYGICMSGGDEFGKGDDSFFPLDIVESGDSLDVIRFVHFAEALMHFIELRRAKRTVPQWAQYLEDIFNGLLSAPESGGEEDALLLENIQSLNTVGEFFTDEMPFDVFIHQFLPGLQTVTRSGAFAGGGITFCSLIPMRSIPFKVVALLGMNFDKLPRKNKPVTFNLMEKERRKGDRNVKENDKHLFLETLLSAGKYLYISYLGQNAKDNSRQPPSILIDELLTFIEKSSDAPSLVRDSLITRQPLHNFSSKYAKSGRLYNYLAAADRKTISLKNEISKPELQREINIESCISFFKNPIKYFYNTILEIFYADEDVTLAETEIFEMDSLRKYVLKKDILSLASSETKDYTLRLIKTGNLPLKNMANLQVETAWEEMANAKILWDGITGGEEKTDKEVKLQLKEFVLQGSMENIYGNKMIVVSLSKNEYKYLFDAYFKSLISSALGLGLEVYFLSAQKEKLILAKQIGTEHAKIRLLELLEIFEKGNQEILPFTFDVNKNHKKWEKYSAGQFRTEMQKVVEGDYCCPYLMREINSGLFYRENVFAAYAAIAEKTLYPLTEIFEEYFN